MFSSIFPTAADGTVAFSPTLTLYCTIASLLTGIIMALVLSRKSNFSKGFAVTLAVLPTIVQAVIMTVNGNLGYGVAVLGAFSLVRFRSVAGSSKEICAIFLAMAVGLINSMGYIAYSICLVIIVGGIMLLLEFLNFGENQGGSKSLNITVPENLDYTSIFDDVFAKFAKSYSLEKVKTTNLGSMFELHYSVVLANPSDEKAFIDAIRCRNGNLTVSLARSGRDRDEL